MVQFNIALVLAFALFIVDAGPPGKPGEKCRKSDPKCDDCYSCVEVLFHEKGKGKGKNKCMPVTSVTSEGSCFNEGDEGCTFCSEGTRYTYCAQDLVFNSTSKKCESGEFTDPALAAVCYNETDPDSLAACDPAPSPGDCNDPVCDSGLTCGYCVPTTCVEGDADITKGEYSCGQEGACIPDDDFIGCCTDNSAQIYCY